MLFWPFILDLIYQPILWFSKIDFSFWKSPPKAFSLLLPIPRLFACIKHANYYILPSAFIALLKDFFPLVFLSPSENYSPI